ncbi:MAG TPA: DNA primase [Bacteroidota bacterium]|nr:DNA primase [Bacteroidota bacterium]
MRIADDTIEEVRRASDIVDVISQYLQLRKRGRNYLGLCPFHQEKTPSFNVSPDKQMYHCFGCGVGGNVFTFIMEHEKVSFVEAVRTLATRAGITLPAEGASGRGESTEHEGLYDACKTAGLYYYDTLVHTVEGKLALEYFRHRGFTDATITKFGLGYSKHAWDGLLQHAAGLKLDPATFEKAGLLLRREDGTYYDRFRGRAMFPIFSPSGRPVGFGARRMREDDQMGKYINSPETPIYVKSRSLYGLFHSKEAIRAQEFAVLVEGYADLISVFQAGVENIVASSGTALTEEQIQLIGRYAKRITLVYDADSAGSKAAMRGVDLIIENGLDVSVATLPEGEDPDSFVKKNGGDAFRKRLAEAVSFLDFKASAFRDQGLLATPEGKTRAVRSIVETIAKMKDEIKRNFYIASVAEKYGVYESLLFRELENILGRERSRAAYQHRAPVPPPPASGGLPMSAVRSGLTPPERDLLKVMLDVGPAMISFVTQHIPPSSFADPLARRAAELIVEHAAQGGAWDVPSLLDRAEDPSLRKFIADIVFNKYELSRGWSALDDPDPWLIAESSILRVKESALDGLIAGNHARMKEAERDGADLTPFREAHQRLQNEKKELKKTRLIDLPGRG